MSLNLGILGNGIFYLEDEFLIDVKNILGLPSSFRYTKHTENQPIGLNPNKLNLIKILCEENKLRRINHNIVSNSKYNIDWSYNVVKLYFNIIL